MYHLTTSSLLDLSSVSHISHSPKGDCAFIKSMPAKSGENYEHYLCLHKDQSLSVLFELKHGLLYFWKDSEHIIYKGAPFTNSDSHCGTFFYEYDLTSGTAKAAFYLPLSVKKIVWKNKTYYFTAACDLRYPDLYKMDHASFRATVTRLEYEDKNYQIVDELPFYFNETGFVNKKRNSLFVYDPQSGIINKISGLYENVSDFAVVGSSIFYSAKEYRAKMPAKERLFRYEKAEDSVITVTKDKDYYFSGMCEFNGHLAFFAADGERYHYWESPSLYMTDSPGDTYHPVLSPGRHPGNKLHLDTAFFGGKILEARKDTLYFLMTDGPACNMFSFRLTDSLKQITDNPGGVLCFSVSPVSDEIVVSALWNGIPNELYLLAPTRTRLSDFNSSYICGRTLYTPEKIPFSFHDHDTDAWIVKPRSFETGKSYPAILYIHGGPLLAFSEAFLHEMQVLSDAGYFVFYCNPAGSDGRGDDFSDIRGRFGIDDYEELMSFTDTVLDMYPEIDRRKVAVTGGSYAGFMTNWIIGHTNRFCCAVSQRSISNWISFYGDTDIGTIYAPVHIKATLFDSADKLWAHSPMKYAKNAETPTLFLHSDEDGCAPLSEAMQMYTALADKGVETRLFIFKGENHNLSRNGLPHHKIKRLEEMLAWFDKYAHI